MFGGITLPLIIVRAITLLIAFPVHELSHAWVATMFGDETPRMYGRLSFNPLKHLDPLGALLFLFAGFGWAKPVPINPRNMSRRSGVMWTSLAGPFSNFVLAIITAIPFRLGMSLSGSDFISFFLLNFLSLNLVLLLFNLIPLAPLDGEKIAEYVWPPAWGGVLEKISRYGTVILLAVVFLLPYLGLDVLGAVLYPPMNNLARLLVGVP